MTAIEDQDHNPRKIPFCNGCGLFHAVNNRHRDDCTKPPEDRDQ